MSTSMKDPGATDTLPASVVKAFEQLRDTVKAAVDDGTFADFVCLNTIMTTSVQGWSLGFGLCNCETCLARQELAWQESVERRRAAWGARKPGSSGQMQVH